MAGAHDAVVEGAGAHAHHHDHDPHHHAHHAPDPHERDHHHDVANLSTRKLAFALAMTAAFCAIEAMAGWIFGSLALLADAGHMLSDAGALLLALFAQRVAARDRTRHRTFGWRRAEVLAAFVNGIALGAAGIFISVEAVRRWAAPPPIDGRAVLLTASIGLVINVVTAFILARGGGHNPNTRAALAHVAADALGSVAAITSALIVLFTGWRRADPLLSTVIALMLAYGAWSLVRRTTTVLMEGAPASIDLHDLERVVLESAGVREAHDLHAWTISEGFDAVSVHVVLKEGFHGVEVAGDVARRIHETFGIDHVTVQPERANAVFVPAEALTRRKPTNT